MFDGGGDSGQINEVVARKGETEVELPVVQVDFHGVSWDGEKLAPSKCTLRDAIEALCFDYLSQEHGGWENNDGGIRRIHVRSLQTQQIELDFNGRFYTDSTSYSHTF